MNILILGSGGREHALATCLNTSNQTNIIYVLPGNAGTGTEFKNIVGSVMDFEKVKLSITKYDIDMVVVGPEDPLAEGIVDYLNFQKFEKEIFIIGPSKSAARLEGSKDFAKLFMSKYSIPCATSKTFFKEKDKGSISLYIMNHSLPIVMKADGLAAGKGVVICLTKEEAFEFVSQVWDENSLGDAGKVIVIEEFLEGIECSFFVLTDGNKFLLLPEAKDYKKIFSGDKGPNTGGMGTVSPVPFCDDGFKEKVISQIIEPTIEGIKQERMDYKGFIFFGIINVNGHPKMIEYNVRLGDPETESILLRIDEDLTNSLLQTARGNIQENRTIKQKAQKVVCIMQVSEGYPGKYEKGKEIIFNKEAKHLNTKIFHAGTKMSEDGKIVSNGGRVLAHVGVGEDFQSARKLAYQSIENSHFNGAFYRDDIGLDIIN